MYIKKYLLKEINLVNKSSITLTLGSAEQCLFTPKSWLVRRSLLMVFYGFFFPPIWGVWDKDKRQEQEAPNRTEQNTTQVAWTLHVTIVACWVLRDGKFVRMFGLRRKAGVGGEGRRLGGSEDASELQPVSRQVFYFRWPQFPSPFCSCQRPQRGPFISLFISNPI